MPKPKVIILHGWAYGPDNQAKWQAFRDQLAGNSIESEFLEIPGLDTRIHRPWSLEDYVTWLAGQLEQETKPVVLLGHSFGGQVASVYTAKHPQKVEHLILIASAGLRDMRPLTRLKRGFFRSVALAGRGVKKYFRDLPRARRFLYRLVGSTDYLQASSNVKKTMQQVVSTRIDQQLEQINVPTTLIWGSHDSTTPVWMAQKFHQSIANSQLHLVEGAKHSPQFTHIDQTAALVVSALSQT